MVDAMREAQLKQARDRLRAKESEVAAQMEALTAPEQEMSKAARAGCLGESEAIVVDRRTAVSTHEQLGSLLAEVRAALEQLDEGRYGVCQECGEQIPEGRLKARPWSTRCVRHS